MSNFDSRAREWDNNPDRARRAEAVAAAIRRQVPLRSDMEALEYGCGTGLLSFALRPYLGAITLADNSAGMLEVVQEKISAAGAQNMFPVRLDLSIEPPLPRTYSLIYTMLAMHHISDLAPVLRGFQAMLAPGGFLCIADLDKEDGTFHEGSFAGYNGFERAEFRQWLLEAGFGNVRFETCYAIPKHNRLYPMFLAIAEKP